MRLPQFHFRNPFRTRRPAPETAATARPQVGANSNPQAGPPDFHPAPHHSAPIPIGGSRPQEPSLPPPAYLGSRSHSRQTIPRHGGSEPGSIESRGRAAAPIPDSPPPRYPDESPTRFITSASPTPSYLTDPRWHEHRMEYNRAGVPIGIRPEGDSGSIVDSLAGRYPVSELDGRRTPASIMSGRSESFPVIGAQDQQARSRENPSDPEQPASPRTGG